ncbi:MAG TPA: alginate lyase family protein [Desulfomonilaceae bacterium]|nr:alginate lyase family protein [Desulfomonilaceae bacterium]
MREPDFPSEEFVRDKVLARELLFSGEDLARLHDEAPENGGLRIFESRKAAFSVPLSDTDLSRFNTVALEVLNLSSTPLLAGVQLSHMHLPDGPEPAPISFSGGREEVPAAASVELKFPMECLGTYGSPDGWKQVREMQFSFCREKGYSGPNDIRLVVRAIYGEFRRIPEGPRLTTAGLARVRKPESSLGSYHRSSQVSRIPKPIAELMLLVPPPHPYPKEPAEHILAGKIMGQSLGNEIDWWADPLGHQEWTHFLNRHHFMRALVLAYVRTGFDRYAAELDRLIARWITGNPVPVGSNGGAGPAWETLSAAWRLREWLMVVEHVWSSTAFRQSTRRQMLRSIWEHAATLMHHTGHPNNWLMVESASLALAGLSFPEFNESGDWLEIGIQRLQTQFSRQFFGDGVHFEISPLYHAICFHALLEVRIAAEQRGVGLPDEFGHPLEACADYLAALCRPDFSCPSLNDSGSAFQDYRALLLLGAEIFRRRDLEWLGSNGTTGEQPRDTIKLFRDAGIAVMRSDYSPDANFLVFRAGPAGASHVHGDALSLDISALGAPRLVDPGITTYAPDRLTEHYRSASGHSTILVNGSGRTLDRMSFRERIRPAGEDLSCVVRDETTAITGMCRGPWKNADGVVLFRTVHFVRGRYWIIQDTASGIGEHEISVCWQFAPGRVEMDLSTFGARFFDMNGASLEIIPLLDSHRPEIEVFTGSFRPPRGWVSVNGLDMPATSCAYHFNAKLPIGLVWLLMPFSGGPACGVEAKLAREETGSSAVEVRFPDGRAERCALMH